MNIDMANFRVGRVAQEILKEVNNILMNDVRDPRIEGVTITDVELTGDLQQAKVYYSTLDTDDEIKKETQTGLDRATGLVRKELGSRLTTYRVPEIAFVRDQSIEYGDRIDELLNQIKKEDQ